MSDTFEIPTLARADIPAAMRLKDAAGWNQTETDWLRLLSFSPDGCFAAEVEGRIIGTVTTIRYEDRFAWIGMMLVDSEYRGRGIGTALLTRTIDHLESK